MTWAITAGDARAVLAGWPAGAVQCVCTSVPYYNLRSYSTEPQIWSGDAACDHSWERKGRYWDNRHAAAVLAGIEAKGQVGGKADARGTIYSETCTRCGAWRGELGSEPTVEQYCANLVDVFRAVRRVLRPDGTLWLNIGDSYSNAGRAGSRGRKRGAGKPGWTAGGALGDKQLLLVPFRVAMALQQDGWILRQVIPWLKDNAMPESTDDRPNTSLEYVFVFAQQPRYYFDMEAVKEYLAIGRNWRNGDFLTDATGPLVFDIPTQAYGGAHFAVMPERLAEACILAGTSAEGQCAACGAPWARVTERTPQYANVRQDRSQPGHKMGQIDSSAWRPPIVTERGWAPTCRCDAGAPVPQVVADPFTGAGTVGVVALRHGRGFWGAELNESYVQMARERIVGDSPLFNRQEGAA
jgi:DNA modification methylase